VVRRRFQLVEFRHGPYDESRVKGHGRGWDARRSPFFGLGSSSMVKTLCIEGTEDYEYTEG
jgi:hypothetical protein